MLADTAGSLTPLYDLKTYCTSVLSQTFSSRPEPLRAGAFELFRTAELNIVAQIQISADETVENNSFSGCGLPICGVRYIFGNGETGHR